MATSKAEKAWPTVVGLATLLAVSVALTPIAWGLIGLGAIGCSEGKQSGWNCDQLAVTVVGLTPTVVGAGLALAGLVSVWREQRAGREVRTSVGASWAIYGCVLIACVMLGLFAP